MPSYLETSMEIAREAGALLAKYFEQHIGFELKGDYDLVTVADRASEQLVIDRLRAHFPTHSIVAEESGGHAGIVGILLVRRSAGRHHEFRARLPGVQRHLWRWSMPAN